MKILVKIVDGKVLISRYEEKGTFSIQEKTLTIKTPDRSIRFDLKKSKTPDSGDLFVLEDGLHVKRFELSGSYLKGGFIIVKEAHYWILKRSK